MLNGISYYKKQSPYSTVNYPTHFYGRSGMFTNDITYNTGINGTQIDNNFYVLEGRDVYNLYLDEKILKLKTLNQNYLQVDLSGLIKQSDWNNSDTTDASYILNKPTNLSDFNNDLNLTSVEYVSSIPDGVDKYQLGTIKINGISNNVYGKVEANDPNENLNNKFPEIKQIVDSLGVITYCCFIETLTPYKYFNVNSIVTSNDQNIYVIFHNDITVFTTETIITSPLSDKYEDYTYAILCQLGDIAYLTQFLTSTNNNFCKLEILSTK